ncbi:MAG: hypothetical protein AAGD01_20815 [Acidobacteriota bacterium]
MTPWERAGWEELEVLLPQDLSAYLETRGWRLSGRREGAALWRWSPEVSGGKDGGGPDSSEKDGGGKGSGGKDGGGEDRGREKKNEPVSLLQPLDPDFDDYSLNLATALEVLARVESRSPREVLESLRFARVDVVRVRAEVPESGSIAVEHGLVLLQEAVDLLRSAARTALVPRPVLRGKPRDRVRAYLADVRLGLPQAGSYVLRIYSPLGGGDEESPEEQDSPLAARPQGYPRQVTVTLMQALDAALDAARRSLGEEGEMAAFSRSVERGVSANFCRALGRLAGTAEEDRAVEIGVDWASAEPPPRQLSPAPIRIESQLADALLNGSDFLRLDRPRPDYQLRGRVLSLEVDSEEPEDPEERGGTARVLERVQGRERRVRVHLLWKDYLRAIQAHEESKLLSCRGTLARSKVAMELQQATEVEIVDPSGQQSLFEPEETRT